MRDLLAELKARAEVVVLDSPPVTALSDAAVLASQTDGVLLVLDSGQTRPEVAKRAMEALGRVNARVVGVLLNRMPAKGVGYYYYYRYDDYYTAGDDSERKNGANGRSGRRRVRTAGQSTAAKPADRTPTQV